MTPDLREIAKEIAGKLGAEIMLGTPFVTAQQVDAMAALFENKGIDFIQRALERVHTEAAGEWQLHALNNVRKLIEGKIHFWKVMIERNITKDNSISEMRMAQGALEDMLHSLDGEENVVKRSKLPNPALNRDE